MTISDTLSLKTTGTSGVIALAEALERAGKAQAALTGASGRGLGKLGEIEARAAADVFKIREKGLVKEQEIRLKSEAAILLAQQRSSAQLHAIDAKGASQFQLNRQKGINALVLERAKQDTTSSAVTLKNKEREAAVERRRIGMSAKAQRRGGGFSSLSSGAGGMAGKGLGGKSNMGVSAIVEGVKLGAVIGVAAATAAATFADAVIQAQAFKEDVSEAFKIVARTDEAAISLMNRANATADKLGVARAKVAGSFLDLTTKGFTENETDRIIRSLADITAIDPRASVEGLTKVIGKVKATGRLNQEALNELSTFGLEQSDVIKEIGKALNKSDKEVVRLLSSAGGIRDLGVEPILRAINAQVGGGEEGAAAIAKARRNMSSLIQQVKDIPSNLLFDLDVSEGSDRVKGALREIIDFFDASSDSGKETRRVLADTFNALTEGFFGIETKGSITETLKSFVQLIADNRENIKTFASDVRSVIGAFASAVPIITAVGAAIYNVFIGLPLDIISGLTYLPTALADIGGNALEAMAGGIRGAASAVIDAVTESIGGAIAWAKKLLGIASPSKVFMEIGAFTSQGFAVGVGANDNAIQRASAAMAGSAVSGAAGAAFPAPSAGPGIVGAGASAGGGIQGSQPIVINVSVTIEGDASKADLAAIEKAAERGARSGWDSAHAASMRRVA